MRDYYRPSRVVSGSKRWPPLRFQALRRDGFQCVQCESRTALQVDHIKPVRDAPELAWELSNLQTLCRRCHARKTRRELGFEELSPDRMRWRNFLNQ